MVRLDGLQIHDWMQACGSDLVAWTKDVEARLAKEPGHEARRCPTQGKTRSQITERRWSETPNVQKPGNTRTENSFSLSCSSYQLALSIGLHRTNKARQRMAKHPVAVYRDANGDEHKIRYEELRFARKLEEARANTLFNETWDFRLSARGGESPHFFALSAGGRRWTDDRRENDPAHNERIAYLIKKLSEFSPGTSVELGTNTWNEPGEHKGSWAPFAEIKDYIWRPEVTRTLSAETRCRHDVFGAKVNDLNLTGRHPWVAIEVIHHHYPTDETLEGLFQISRLLPLVVMFDLVQRKNYFMHIDAEHRRIRAIYYIYNGALWENDRNLGHDVTSTRFEAMVKRKLEALDKGAA